jgi:hypothetical protein
MVSIYERSKDSAGWHERYVPPPKRFTGGSLGEVCAGDVARVVAHIHFGAVVAFTS